MSARGSLPLAPIGPALPAGLIAILTAFSAIGLVMLVRDPKRE
jgi:hypothetical protein